MPENILVYIKKFVGVLTVRAVIVSVIPQGQNHIGLDVVQVVISISDFTLISIVGSGVTNCPDANFSVSAGTWRGISPVL